MNLKKTTIMKKFLSFIALAAVCGLGFAQNSAIFKAQDLQAKGDLNGAIELLEAAMQNPKTTKLAEVYHYAAEYEAQRFNPELMKAAQSLPFDTLLFCNALDKSIGYYLKSHEIDVTPDEKGRVKSKFVKPNHDRVLSMLDFYNYAAVFANGMGDQQKSIEYFSKYMELPKASVFSKHETDSIYAAGKQAYLGTAKNIAILSYQGKNWDEALKYAEIALEDTTDAHDLYIIKMQSYLAKSDSVGYLNALKEAATNSHEVTFMQNLLYHYVTKGDADEAMRMADEMVQQNPENKAAWYMKGCVDLNMTKNYVAARESFQKALDLDPNFVDANTNMAYTYINEIVQKKQNGEFQFIGTSRTYTKKEEPVYKKELALVHDYYGKAKIYMEKVRELTPESPKEWAYVLQQIYTNLDEKDKLAEINALIETLNP